MTTQLQGKETQFLPFNRDTQNAILYDRFAVSYLWACSRGIRCWS